MFTLPVGIWDAGRNMEFWQSIAFNLIEIFLVCLPFEWWLSRERYRQLNDYVMGFIYSPLLLLTSYLERRAAHKVLWNRKRGEAEDDIIHEWEVQEAEDETEDDDWTKKVIATRPNIQTDTAVLEIRSLQKDVAQLKEMLERLPSHEGRQW